MANILAWHAGRPARHHAEAGLRPAKIATTSGIRLPQTETRQPCPGCGYLNSRPRNALGFARLSDLRLLDLDEDGQAKGNVDQERRIRDYAKTIGWKVSRVIVENDLRRADGTIKGVSAFKRRKVHLPNGRHEWRTYRPGLRLALDLLARGAYPTGVKVSHAAMEALPITRHNFHGDWNYTLHSQPPDTTPADGSCQDTQALPNPADLSDPCLTGMSRQQLHALSIELEALHHNDIASRQYDRRVAAGKKPHAPRPGQPMRLTFPDRVLATILRLRLAVPDKVLAAIFARDPTTICRAIADTRHLLDLHGTTIEPVTAPAPLAELLNAGKDPHTKPKIKPAC